MNTFNFKRFLNFGKYDLAINRSFYRSAAIIFLVTSLSITVLSFLTRYIEAKEYQKLVETAGDALAMYKPDWHAHPGTTVFLAAFFAMAVTVLAGCWAHNMRTRQSRIIELTLPATNLEKFAWHLAVNIGGGFVMSAICILASDLLNYVLTLCWLPEPENVQSIVKEFIAIFVCNVDGYGAGTYIPVYMEVALRLLMWGGVFAQLSFYVLGNAIKYRYNIIITYFVLQVLGVMFIGTLMGVIISFDSMGRSDAQNSANLTLYTTGAISWLVAVLCTYLSYVLYSRAQITTKLNK